MTRESFLERWSRRKLDDEAVEPAEEAVAEEAASDPEPAVEAEDDPAEPHPTELIDIETLDYSSDFTQFMAKGVPAAVKRQALRKLWTSNPVLANMDGLNDYEDIVKTFGIKELGNTGWKIGRGFLTDEDLGLTKPKDEAEASDEEKAEAGEPEVIEDQSEAAEAVPVEPADARDRVALRRGHDGFDDTEEM